jgi:hypothetical protein
MRVASAFSPQFLPRYDEHSSPLPKGDINERPVPPPSQHRDRSVAMPTPILILLEMIRGYDTLFR